MTTLSSKGPHILFPAEEASWGAKTIRGFCEGNDEYGV